VQQVRLVEQHYRTPLGRSDLLGPRDEPLPEAGERRLGRIGRGIESRLAGLVRDLEQEGGLANLPRPREQLDATRRRLGESTAKLLSARAIVEPEGLPSHTRIIIRL
jgi:hypothetical protein